jgi:NAD(P)-dependent dehydrogenase (short-subunit alcohol dehydrogenase family)
MNISFENKIALVTGAASELGLATAKAFAESDASVVLADWNESSAFCSRGTDSPRSQALAILSSPSSSLRR